MESEIARATRHKDVEASTQCPTLDGTPLRLDDWPTTYFVHIAVVIY
jgi:hypothetical protein